MKKMSSLLIIAAMAVTLLAGCRGGVPAESSDNTGNSQTIPSATEQTGQSEASSDPTDGIAGMANTESARILAKIWESYGENERFASYGGTVEHSVSDAPGDLDLSNTEEIVTKYMMPEDQLPYVEEAASLVHLMNSNIFTGVVFRLKADADLSAVAKALRTNVQQTRWICGQPDRLLIAQVEGQLLMVFGGTDVMNTFKGKLQAAYQNTAVLYDEAVTA